MHAITLGIDIGKRWFHVVGLDAGGRAVAHEKFNRAQLYEFFATHPTYVIGMDTYCGAQHLARLAVGHGHDFRWIPAHMCDPSSNHK